MLPQSAIGEGCCQQTSNNECYSGRPWLSEAVALTNCTNIYFARRVQRNKMIGLISDVEMAAHTIFEILAWLCAFLISQFIARRGYLITANRTPKRDPGYFIALGIGAIIGALLFGSVNMTLAGMWQIGHSIAGAVVGGIVAVEFFKWVTGVRGSTGGQFVAPLAIGIAVGRLGCFFAGLPDYTYGIPTRLPWGVDFGDGILRHPVQIYESVSMLLFLVVYMHYISRGSVFFQRQGFYVFVGWYAVQRFLWEFLKPYPTVIGPFNLFQLVCIAMFGYSLFMMRRNYEFRTAI
jgi:phosphatidylglycerol---prolipoprotein diacylglyceryl transferase